MRRKIPGTWALVNFEAAARHQSFTKAASELSLTQSAVCRQISGIEDYLGVRLFRRSKRGVTLTDAGQTYARQVAILLDSIERETLELMSRHGTGGYLNLAVVPTFASRWLVPRLASFQAAHSHVTVNLTTRTRPFLFEETEFDAAIYSGAPNWPGAEAIRLMPEDVAPVCSPKLIAPRKRITPQGITNYPLLQQTTRPYAWRHWFEAAGVKCESALAGPRYELFSMLSEAAMAEMGFALIPCLLLEQELKTGRLIAPVPRTLTTDRCYYLAYPERKAECTAIMLFRDWLVGCATEYMVRTGQALLQPE